MPAGKPPSSMDTRPVAFIVLGSTTDIGRQRDQNQDSLLCFTPVTTSGVQPKQGWLYAVADGMGGYEAGEVASKLAVETLIDHYAGNTVDATDDPAGVLQQGVAVANRAVYQRGRELGLDVMGTTLVCVAVRGDQLYVAHVGDSRAYLLRDNTLKALTRDHSLVGEQVRQGFLTEEEAQDSDLRGIVTRALGMKPQVQADIGGPIPLRAADVVLLCSDGVCGYVLEDQIRYILQTHRAEPQAAADFLVEAANAAGGFDNATAVVLYVSRIEHIAVEDDRAEPDADQSVEVSPATDPIQPAARSAGRSNTETITLPPVPPVSPAVSSAGLEATEPTAAVAPPTAPPLEPAPAEGATGTPAPEQTSDRLRVAPPGALSGLLSNPRAMIALAALLVVVLVVAVLIAFSLGRNGAGSTPASGITTQYNEPPARETGPTEEAPAGPVSVAAEPAAATEVEPAPYTIALAPQAPLIALTQLSVITTQAQAGVVSAVTLTFRTNATIAEPREFSATVDLSQPNHDVRVELAPQVNFDRQEQVKIEVLAEEDGAGAVSTWTVGTLGLPSRPGLRMRSRLIMLISLKPAVLAQRSSLPIRLFIRWLGTGAIPGDFKPEVSR